MGLFLYNEEPAQQPDVDVFHLRSDCSPIFGLWCRLQTQWAHGFNGPTGMRWESCAAWMGLVRHPLRRDPEAGEYLRIMETAHLVAAAEREAQRRTEK